MSKRRRTLIEKYEISKIDILVYEFLKTLLGKNKAFKFISKYSKWKYGKKDNLSRFYCENYFNFPVGKYSYGWKPLLKFSTFYLDSIGAFCSIAAGVSVAEGQHPTNYITTSPIAYNPDFKMAKEFKQELQAVKLVIGNDVWIGANAILFSGIKIGNGAIIGAGAVVNKDVPDYAIVAGVPAKIIRYRFNNDVIDSIKQSKWWEWEDKKIREIFDLLPNPEKFIVQCKGEV